MAYYDPITRSDDDDDCYSAQWLQDHDPSSTSIDEYVEHMGRRGKRHKRRHQVKAGLIIERRQHVQKELPLTTWNQKQSPKGKIADFDPDEDYYGYSGISSAYRAGTYPTLTSTSHPLIIDTIPMPSGKGRLGLTFCPGKIDFAGTRCNWSRDLNLDLDSIDSYGAKLLITLMPTAELERYQVKPLGERWKLRPNYQWLHLPITDMTAPTLTWFEHWSLYSGKIRDYLADGGTVVVHCKGGIGRAGTVGSLILRDQGFSPEDAIATVRLYRHKRCVETPSQENAIINYKPNHAVV